MEQQTGGMAMRRAREDSAAHSSRSQASTPKTSPAHRPSRPILINPNVGRRVQFLRAETEHDAL